jgi:hypothetical protein
MPLFPDRALAHHRVRRLAKNAKIHSTPSRDDSVERQVAQVVALHVRQPVKAPTAQATADGAPVPAGLAGAALIKRKSNRAEVAVQHVR